MHILMKSCIRDVSNQRIAFDIMKDFSKVGISLSNDIFTTLPNDMFSLLNFRKKTQNEAQHCFIILKLYHRIHFSGTVFLLLFALAIEQVVENMALSTFNKLIFATSWSWAAERLLLSSTKSRWKLQKNIWMSESCSTGREHVQDFRYIDIG